MLMIYSAIFTLFLTSRISALAAPPIVYSAVGVPPTVNLTLRAPAIVYSAVIYNVQRSTIHCIVFRSQPSGPILSSGTFTIKNEKYQLIKEVTYHMGTWTAAAIIEKIQCGNLVVNAPFANVTSPVQNWEFRVERNQIVSVGPSSYNPHQE
ncbi:unnamed protein product [Rotaria magnacalcarata]|uniref:Uncharacterized protein n=1 Tax=Rotaria magnacalcarata TaxID=392030 RepID=A0A820QTT7_9BILA|nr:unnamed protein product [Rotaria magnacalcarata]CAF2083405.1 unnamed protein product [Rotaria magnacalcarata]CAF2104279.1 unnamed protein product [Rotaria magnacalcarata]CAF2156425.1 unnamed protein product [Rotaria magnacalcarata]CAF4160132.1 unnamed protein product [Rotaria magnacalcarata]